MEKANTTSHVHATVIKAWADGRAVQYYSKKKGKWLRANNPTWREKTKYRVRTSDYVETAYDQDGEFLVKLVFDGVTKQPIRIAD